MHMTISGDATSTGKSLFQTVWMTVFQGEPMPTLTSISEASAYDMLADGKHIYGNYNSDLIFGNLL